MSRFERWPEIRSIVERALDLDAEARSSFIDESCGADDELRREVEALLHAPPLPTSAIGSLLGLPNRTDDPDYTEGDAIDHFTIVRLIGRGGMGAVYEARDTKNSDRPVAFKVLFSRAAKVSQDKRLAGFSDPSIVTFHDSGETPDGLPYFVFEYVDGEPITTFCEHRNLGLDDRLRLFTEVCAAVQHAHQRLVIHCDLKPENILVTPAGALKLLDFGIAKAVGEATIRYPAPLTLPFASPEQVGNEETTTLSDVYSLGVLLCVLLTGRLPYSSPRRIAELSDAILHEEPILPSTLVRLEETTPADYPTPPAGEIARLAKRLMGDLDAIILRALQKEPEKRYQSAQELSVDIRRYRDSYPVSARPGSRSYRIWMAIKRHRKQAIGAALLALLLLGAFGVWFRQYRATVRERDAAKQETRRAEEVTSFLTDIFRLSDPVKQPGASLEARELLDRAAAELPDRLPDQPETHARLLNTLGEIYQNLGLQEPALKCHQQALRVARAAKELPLAADTLLYIGVIQRNLGQYPEAEAAFTDSLETLKSLVPGTDSSYTYALYQLASIASFQGKMSRSEALHREALNLRRTAPQRDEEEITSSLNALGDILQVLQRTEEATKILREALLRRRRLYGPRSVYVADTMSNLANALLDGREHAEAERYFREVVEIYTEIFGLHHPRMVIGQANLGSFLLAAGRSGEAEVILRECLGNAEVTLGREHPNAIVARMKLGLALCTSEQGSEADDLLAEAHLIATGLSSEDLYLLARIIEAQAQCAFERSQYSNAESHFRRASELFRETQGETGPDFIRTRSELARTLVEQRRLAEAEPLLLDYFDRASETQRADALQNLIRLYEAWGKREEALEYRELLKAEPAATEN